MAFSKTQTYLKPSTRIFMTGNFFDGVPNWMFPYPLPSSITWLTPPQWASVMQRLAFLFSLRVPIKMPEFESRPCYL